MPEKTVDTGVMMNRWLVGPDGSFYVLAAGNMPGVEWPVQGIFKRLAPGQRDASSLNILIRIHPTVDLSRLGLETGEVGIGRDEDFFGILRYLKREGRVTRLSQLQLVLLDMPGRFTGSGREWDAPGGMSEAYETAQGGAVRERDEEAGGGFILGMAHLFPQGLVCSGRTPEVYSIFVSLVAGNLAPGGDARRFELVRLDGAEAWFRERNEGDPWGPDYQPVDLKVIMAVTTLILRLKHEVGLIA